MGVAILFPVLAQIILTLALMVAMASRVGRR
jgi:hypothetical protein